ncbi:MAG: 16S rRNA (guanine(527)-N(7))-methyltransferase RsmG [Saprospirales bacterium]|nr:16S rRNA (guanine(527)-N(7))-methyltransferase RsmG [Saprospirales bacterium]
MQMLEKYFLSLTALQQARFGRLEPLYREWNEKINVISRQDIDHLELHHVLHSLAIAKVFAFKPGARLLDLGTGGGFPGIPLAILLPEVDFTLVDGTGKKITVVKEVVQALELSNVTALHCRVEELKMPGAFDFVVSRAVAPLDKLLLWSHRLFKKKHLHAYPNGLIALKGGNINAELAALPGDGRSYTDIFPIQNYIPEPWFEDKWVVYVQG